MSSMETGQNRRSQDRSGPLLSLIAAACVFSMSPAIIAQEGPEITLPGPHARAVTASGTVEVTFVDPFGISAASDLRVSAPELTLASADGVIVRPDSAEGGSKSAGTSDPQVPASLTLNAPPRQPITILVDDVVAGAGYSLSDFRCSYNAGGETACDGPEYSEMSVANGTLLVGATLTGNGSRAAGGFEGSFAVIISYQ